MKRIDIKNIYDRFLGSDPGLNRLRSAIQTLLAIGVSIEAEYLFVKWTHALQMPINATHLSSAQIAQITTINHEYTIIAMLLGAIIAMISSIAVMDKTIRDQLITLVLLPVVMIPALVFGIFIGNYPLPALVLFAVILAFVTYLRRFGPRGFALGIIIFIGYFFGFFLHKALPLQAIFFISVEIIIGLLVSTVIRFVFFFPNQKKALSRTQQSFAARARKVADLALKLFENKQHIKHASSKLTSELTSLNETALMIDAQLEDTEGTPAARIHQQLFDIELALTNIARFAKALAQCDLDNMIRQEIHSALHSIVERDDEQAEKHAKNILEVLSKTNVPLSGKKDTTNVILHRFADSVIDLTHGLKTWNSVAPKSSEKETFEPSVQLFGGWLPGSSKVSTTASKEKGHLWWDRIQLEPYTRTAIQMGVAVGIATILGSLLSPMRFYWAVIAVFVTFMGVNNAAEQVQKAVFRVLGTIIGIFIGSLFVMLVGTNTDGSITIILLSVFFGIYLIRINYTFMVIGITVMISQLYLQLNEFSNALLLERLEETAIGSAVAILVVLFVLPLRTRFVLKIALREYVEAVQQLVDHATNHLLGTTDVAKRTLRSDARAIDATYQAFIATARPIRRNLFGSIDEEVSQQIRLVSAARHYSRNVVKDAEEAGILQKTVQSDIAKGAKKLHENLTVLTENITKPSKSHYIRSASLFDKAERQLINQSETLHNGRLPMRDLKLLDGTLAQLAETLNIPVTDYDTVKIS